MSCERIPFKVLGIDLISKIDEFNQKRKEVHRIWNKFAEKHGGTSAASYSSKCIGVVFPDKMKIPKGWYHPKWMDKYSILNETFHPRRRSPDWNDFYALPYCPDQLKLAHCLGFDPDKNNPPGPEHGYIVSGVSYIFKNGFNYVSIPAYYFKHSPIPEGLEEIKVTEWDALWKEEDEGV